MARKRKGPVPTGWTRKTEVQKDGSKTTTYYCPDTRQHFSTYADLIRYVEYAKEAGVGIYSLCCKSVRKDKNAKNRKTSSILSLPKHASKSNSVTVDLSSDSKSPTLSEGTDSDEEEDEDYVPKPDGDDDERLLSEMRSSKQPKEDEDYVPEPDGDDDERLLSEMRRSKQPKK